MLQDSLSVAILTHGVAISLEYLYFCQVAGRNLTDSTVFSKRQFKFAGSA